LSQGVGVKMEEEDKEEGGGGSMLLLITLETAIPILTKYYTSVQPYLKIAIRI